ncbi:DUF1735 domain-containing protein [Pontibacter sp. SGAir0037]|uniref:DUF1735 domain-containing protein n=1 Tax=Pontibacter sp. SGAir0037 TaxID=2571030 RepID=UPI0010CD075F|nr:DUF1735 domain-containing protein [Pontibacter sp. SGAir0037]QCR24284.1 hypothetical protein C1N53_19265 [Pontibacter sp. SGAir0037]
MKRKILGFLLFSLTFTVLFTSCIDNEVEELEDRGRTYIKLLEAPENIMFFQPFEDSKKIDLLSIRRDANSTLSLNSTVTVTLVPAPELIEQYNEDNEEAVEPLPAEFFTLANSAFTSNGNGGYTVTLAPGKFSEELTIMLNGQRWEDLTQKYGVAFRIQDANGLPITTGGEEVVTVLAIANRYDGIYSMTASMTASDRPTVNATGTEWTWPGDVYLVTTGENTVDLFDAWGFGTYILPIQTNTGGWSGFGSASPRFTFDMETNEITSVVNTTVNPANGRAFQIDPTGPNYFDPETHTVYASFIMTQTTATTNFEPLKIRVTFNYKGAR